MTAGRTHRYSHFPVIGCACHTCNYCRDKIGMADAPAEGTPELLQGFDTMTTTTPDSRITHDWHLDAPPGPECALQPIDTSTTAGRIAVMQAWERGDDVEVRVRGEGCPWRKAYGSVSNIPNGSWNWAEYDYRIAPPPAPRTALQRARACRAGMDAVNSESPDGILCSLLTDIDYAPVVEVLERRISWDAADLSALPKGRYRLVRDDA